MGLRWPPTWAATHRQCQVLYGSSSAFGFAELSMTSTPHTMVGSLISPGCVVDRCISYAGKNHLESVLPNGKST